MKKININKLQAGDIILTTSGEKASSLIRLATTSDISHAMICVAYGSVMDSTKEGVQARNIQQMLYDNNAAIYILRTRQPLPTDVLGDIIKYARSSTGTSYSILEAAAVVTSKRSKPGTAKMFCSRMVARAYASAGIQLVSNPDFCSPEELKESKLLMKIDPAWISASAAEMETIKKMGDTTKEMRTATQELLRQVRILDPNIESLNDINSFLIQRPDRDFEISDALKSSGYLDLCNIELSRFPWRYDPHLIVQFYNSFTEKESILEYCRATLRDHADGVFTHWEVSAKGYDELNAAYPRESFKLLIKLYQTLNSNHSMRIFAAQLILNVYGGLIED